MHKNVGTVDRVVRVLLGLVLLGVAYQQGTTAVGIVVGILGLASLLTGLFSFCWLYKLLGMSTKKDAAMPAKPMPAQTDLKEQTEVKEPEMPEQNQGQDQQM